MDNASGGSLENRSTSFDREAADASKSTGGPILQLESASLRRLSIADRRRSVRTLHLSARAVNALAACSVLSIGDFVDAVERGLQKIPAIGELSLLEIAETICALARSVPAAGEIDWEEYAKKRHILVLPSRKAEGSDVADASEIMTAVSLAARTQWGGTREYLLRKYYLDPTGTRHLLPTLAKEVGLTKQAASLSNLGIMETLQDAIFYDDYAGLRFRFRSSLVDPLRKVATALQRKGVRLLSRTEWEETVREITSITAVEFPFMHRFFLALFGYIALSVDGKQFDETVMPIGRDPVSIKRALIWIDRTLRSHSDRSLSASEIWDHISQVTPGRLTPADLPAMIGSINDVEFEEETQRYRKSPSAFFHRADHLQLILQQSAAPMHLSKLAEALATVELRASPASTVGISNALSNDPRFVPIGRSGFWALKEWNVETRSIQDLAYEILSHSAKPLTEAELFSRMSKLRPLSRLSIARLLDVDNRFKRAAPQLWGIAKGREMASSKSAH